MTTATTIRKRIGLLAVAAGSTLALGSIALGGVAHASKPDSNGNHKVTICHAVSGLGETKHGYNVITVDVASIFSGAHPTHVHAGRHDIIPAFDYLDKNGNTAHFDGLGDSSWIATGCAPTGDTTPVSTDPVTTDTTCSSDNSGHDGFSSESDSCGSGDCSSSDSNSGRDSFSSNEHSGDNSGDHHEGDNEDCTPVTEPTTPPTEATTPPTEATTPPTEATTPPTEATTPPTEATIAPSSSVTPTTPTTPTTAAPTTSAEIGGPVPTTAKQTVAESSGALPSTGSSQTLFLVLGLAMVLGGVIFVIMSRRPDEA